MAENNFFKFNLKHQVVKDFNDDHRKSIKLYQDSYAYLMQLDKLRSVDEPYKQGVEFYRNINRTHALMEETFTNLFISYYAFRKASEENPEIKEEFKKMPPDFSPVMKQFTDMIEGYKIALNKIKEVI